MLISSGKLCQIIKRWLFNGDANTDGAAEICSSSLVFLTPNRF